MLNYLETAKISLQSQTKSIQTKQSMRMLERWNDNKSLRTLETARSAQILIAVKDILRFIPLNQLKKSVNLKSLEVWVQSVQQRMSAWHADLTMILRCVRTTMIQGTAFSVIVACIFTIEVITRMGRSKSEIGQNFKAINRKKSKMEKKVMTVKLKKFRMCWVTAKCLGIVGYAMGF